MNARPAPDGAAALYHRVFDATPDGILVIDAEGRIVEANPAACTLYGRERAQLIGASIADLTHEDDHAALNDALQRVHRGGSFLLQVVGRRRDGYLFEVEIHGSSVPYAGAPHVLGVVRDTTDRERSVRLLERRVQERTRELSTLLQVSRDVVSTLRLGPLLAQTLDRLKDVVEYEAAAIFALEGEEALTLLDYRGPRSRASLPRHWDLSQAEHLRMVLDHRRPLVIPDVRASTLQARAWQRSWGAQLGQLAEDGASWLGVPLLVKDQFIGTLTLEHTEAGHFTPLHAKLALAFANQVAVAMENARLYEESQRLGILEERQRIARELHDSVSQTLYSIGLGAQTAQALLARDPKEAAEPLEYVLSLAEDGLAEMRALILELRPDALAHEGLVAALHNQCAAFNRRYDLAVTTAFDGEPAAPIEVKEALYRVAHEALYNIVKHAGASEVRIALRVDDAHVALTVEDNGVGFDPHQPYPGHFGLQSMRERIERLGGTVAIASAIGAGTRIQATVPLTSE